MNIHVFVLSSGAFVFSSDFIVLPSDAIVYPSVDIVLASAADWHLTKIGAIRGYHRAKFKNSSSCCHRVSGSG